MLTEDQERDVLWAIQREWRLVNFDFDDAMKPPAFALSSNEQILGRYNHELRILEISRTLLLKHPWSVLVEVLRHEVAHQYVAEVLRVQEDPHGPAFRRVCEARAIDARACGTPAATDPEDLKILARVEKLLALAGSSNQHEAELAMSKAQRLMLQHNLDLAAAHKPLRYGFKHLGRASRRTPEHERRLALILMEHFFVNVLWVSQYDVVHRYHATILEVCGTPENLAIAEYVYNFLIQTATRLWLEHKRTLAIQGDRDRRSFMAGVMRGFAAKLEHQIIENAKTGLVWVGEPGLNRYFDARHPRVVMRRRSGGEKNSAFFAGQTAGGQIVLHRGVEHSQSRGLALPPKSGSR